MRKRYLRDNVLLFEIMEKLLENPRSTKAYKIGLIDDKGFLKKYPTTEIEKRAFTPLDAFICYLRDLMGSRLNNLRKFNYMKTFNNSIKDDVRLINEGRAKNMDFLKRISKDMYGKVLNE